MRRLILAAAAAAAFTMSLGAAEAMPVAPADALEASTAITLVSGGCGPYGHRTPYGNCRPNGPRRFYGQSYGFYGGPRFYRPYHPYHRFYGPQPFFRY